MFGPLILRRYFLGMNKNKNPLHFERLQEIVLIGLKSTIVLGNAPKSYIMFIEFNCWSSKLITIKFL